MYTGALNKPALAASVSWLSASVVMATVAMASSGIIGIAGKTATHTYTSPEGTGQLRVKDRA